MCSVLTENEVCEVHVYGYQNIGMYSVCTMVKNNRDVYTMKQSSWWCSLIDTPWLIIVDGDLDTLWWWCPMLSLMMFLILWWTLVPAHKPSVIITEVAEVTIQALTEVCMVQVQNSRDQVCKNAIWTVSRHIQ